MSAKRPADDTHFKQTRLAEVAVIFAAGLALVVAGGDGDSTPTFLQGVGGVLMFGAAYLRYPILRPMLSGALDRLPKFASKPDAQ